MRDTVRISVTAFSAILFSGGYTRAFAEDAAELRAGLLYGRNEGKHVLETGSRTPDALGFAGGSRLTYPRNFDYYGLSLDFSRSLVDAGFRYRTTLRYVDTGTTYNEDFVLPSNSGQQENGFDTSQWAFRDSAEIFSGNRNFALSYARTDMLHYDLETSLKFYISPLVQFFDTGRLPRSDADEGLYLATSLRYAYFKFYAYEAVQWIGTRDFVLFGPIGIGNSFANAVLEFPVGPGYRFAAGDFRFDASLLLVSGYNYARDHHVQRGINFIVEYTGGEGFQLNLGAEYRWNEDYDLSLRFYGHRYYSRGHLQAEGGYGSELLVVALSGSQPVWINTKEAGLEIAVRRRIQ